MTQQRDLVTNDSVDPFLCTLEGTDHDFRAFTAEPAYPGAVRRTYWRCVWCHGVSCGGYGEDDPCWLVYHHSTGHRSRSGVEWPLSGTRPDAPWLHTRGEFVLGLGWSCVECDTFHCPVANAKAESGAPDA